MIAWQVGLYGVLEMRLVVGGFGLVLFLASPIYADELLHGLEGTTTPSDPSTDWIVGNPCTNPCTETVETGHFVRYWSEAGDMTWHSKWITFPDETPPETLWVEWRFRSNRLMPLTSYSCDAAMVIFRGDLEVVYLLGNAAVANSGNQFILGLDPNEFHSYRFESPDRINYRVSVDGEVFIVDALQNVENLHYLQVFGIGNCPPPSASTTNEWDMVRYGTLTYGDAISSTDPPAGVLDPLLFPTLDRFTITYDSPNYVYIEDITVSVTSGEAPLVLQTRRLDNGDPETVEIVLDRALALGATTTFTFDDGDLVQSIAYTLPQEGTCCHPDGLCTLTPNPDCTVAGGIFHASGTCQTIEACCLPDGSCQNADTFCCVHAGGTASGPSSDCGLDADTDIDGVHDFCDNCPDAPNSSQVDSDGDSIGNACDLCAGFPDELDDDNDGVPDGCDACAGFDDAADADGDGAPDGCDGCPADPLKTHPGPCGCGVSDVDSDDDTLSDCLDGCPNDPLKIDPGVCGCHVSDTADLDSDFIPDCTDQCPGVNDAVFGPGCTAAIPTASHWGLAVIALCLLIAAKLAFGLPRKTAC